MDHARLKLVRRAAAAAAVGVAGVALFQRRQARRQAPDRQLNLALPTGSEAAKEEGGSLLFIGTATMLIHYGPFTILTDPNFLHLGDTAPLGYGLHTIRLTNPAVEIDELPPLDLVVLSHLHADHFDRVAIDRLDKRLPILTTFHGASGLAKQGFTATHALATWESMTLHKAGRQMRVTSMPAKHAPGPLGAVFPLPPVMGSMIDFLDAGSRPEFRLYLSGDTLLFDGLRTIRREYGEIDLGIFHLGGTRVMGMTVTLDAEMGVEAVRIIRPRAAIPVHYDDYAVFKSPLADFQHAVAQAGLSTNVTYLSRGDSYPLTPRRVLSQQVGGLLAQTSSQARLE